MVYRGKPSRGCATCRKRKIKCDQRAEGCFNCEKSKRECPGYRDQLDLRFLNETDAVVRRSHVPKSRAHSHQASTPSSADTPSFADDPAQGKQLQLQPRDAFQYVSPLLFPSDDELGEGFFFTNYVVYNISPQRTVAWPTNTLDDSLVTTSRAVGLAGLASWTHSPKLMNQARQRYLEAVHRLNVALADPDQARKDSTLIATMLLSHFETMAGRGSSSITAWKNHIHGGAALLKLRGVDQLKTSAGARLFVQVVSSLNLSCIRYNMPIPEDIMVLARILVRNIDARSRWLKPWLGHWECSIDFTNYNARLRNGLIEDPVQAYKEAKALDDRYEELFARALPDDGDVGGRGSIRHLYKTVYPEVESPLVYDGFYHVYSDFFVVQMLDSMRANRIILSRMIRVMLSNDLATGSKVLSRANARAEMAKYTRLTQRYASDILASVPQHLGFGADGRVRPATQWFNDTAGFKFLWSNFEDVYYPLHPTAQDGTSDWDSDGSTQPLLRMFGGFLLPLVVYLVGKSDLSTPSMREYAMKALRTIAEDFGLQQSLTLARDVKNTVGVPDSEDVALEDEDYDIELGHETV